MAKQPRMTDELAETFALQGLAFLAGDPARLNRFLGLTGIDVAELKEWDGNRPLQAAVLDHLLRDESLLLVFAAEAGIEPLLLAPAHAKLNGVTEY